MIRLSLTLTLLLQGCVQDQIAPEHAASNESLVPASTTPVTQTEPPTTPPAASPSATPAGSADAPELSPEGIGQVKLGMSYAELVWAKLDPQFIDGGVAVGPIRAGFAPARGGPIVSVFVQLADLPAGIRVGGKVLKNETTSLQQLADAVGACEPIAPNIGQASTTCHGGRIELYGAGPVGGVLRITVKSS